MRCPSLLGHPAQIAFFVIFLSGLTSPDLWLTSTVSGTQSLLANTAYFGDRAAKRRLEGSTYHCVNVAACAHANLETILPNTGIFIWMRLLVAMQGTRHSTIRQRALLLWGGHGETRKASGNDCSGKMGVGHFRGGVGWEKTLNWVRMILEPGRGRIVGTSRQQPFLVSP